MTSHLPPIEYFLERARTVLRQLQSEREDLAVFTIAGALLDAHTEGQLTVLNKEVARLNQIILERSPTETRIQ